MGLLPRQFWGMTFWEFAQYSYGFVDRDKLEWNRAASIMAILANVNRDAKRRPKPFTADDFSPYGQEKSTPRELTQTDFDQLLKWRENLT